MAVLDCENLCYICDDVKYGMCTLLWWMLYYCIIYKDKHKDVFNVKCYCDTYCQYLMFNQSMHKYSNNLHSLNSANQTKYKQKKVKVSKQLPLCMWSKAVKVLNIIICILITFWREVCEFHTDPKLFHSFFIVIQSLMLLYYM